MDNYEIKITNRNAVTLSGIREVLGFDDNNVAMDSEGGQLTLDGSELNITRLDLEKGIVEVKGKINGLYYMEQKVKGDGLFRRLFS